MTNAPEDELAISWAQERQRNVTTFDAVADLYRARFTNELDRKPFDQELLGRVARDAPAGEPVLEVGAGPGQIGQFLAERGVRVIVSDASAGQVAEARMLAPDREVVLADLARLPVRPFRLGGIVAFYCLIYGPPEPLDAVFADWRRALHPGSVIALAVHAGTGELHADEWMGHKVDMTVVLRDPDDLADRLERNGFLITEHVVRRPYRDERFHRCYILAEAQ